MNNLSDILLEQKMDLIGVKKYDDPGKNAVWNYVAGYTVTDINKMLRQDRRLKSLTVVCDLIDSQMQTLKPMTLYRTVEWDYLKNIYNIDKKNLDSCLGYEFIANAYTSTTKTRKSVWSSKWFDYEVLMEIETNRKTKGVVINDMFDKTEIDCADQEEVLLQRKLHFVITDYYMMSENGLTRTPKKKNVYCLIIKLV